MSPGAKGHDVDMTNHELIYQALLVVVPKYLAPYVRWRLDNAFGVGKWGPALSMTRTSSGRTGDLIHWNDARVCLLYPEPLEDGVGGCG